MWKVSLEGGGPEAASAPRKEVTPPAFPHHLYHSSPPLFIQSTPQARGIKIPKLTFFLRNSIMRVFAWKTLRTLASKLCACFKRRKAMINRLWLFGLIFGIPLLGLMTSEGIQVYYNSQLRSAAQKQVPDIDPKVLSGLSLDRICEKPNPEMAEVCSANSHLNLMTIGSVGAAALGLALILAIYFAGSAAQNDRRLLLSIFKPGFYVTVIVLIGLVILNATIMMAALYYGESVLINRVHLFIIGAVGIGAFLGIKSMISNLFSLLRKAETRVIGKTVSREQAPALWEKVDEFAERLGALQPQQIVVGLDPNFFVTEADVVCLDGTLSGRTLYCSLPLCRIINEDEFAAIIGHELGHYHGQDTEYSLKFYPIYRGTLTSIAALQSAGNSNSKLIALLPAIAVLGYFFESFATAESRISRQRELAADQAGISLTSPKTLAAALVKVHAFSGLWETVDQMALDVMKGKRC
ncbi:MAG: M48 family metallopeptidase [Candidatus Manganitrophus sp.]|nr:MAG: M48 family metallopeptidase [Candidatus Manganitrophus sp.]